MHETGTLNEPVGERASLDYRSRYKFTWRLRLGWVWARYLMAGRGWDVPELIDFIFNNYFFIPQQLPGELTALGEILAEMQPQRALEIGTGRGGTLLFVVSLAGRTATIASIDLGAREGGYSATRQWFYERFARRKQHLHLIRGNSRSFWMRRRLGEVFDGRPLDFLFIDGDHRYEGVKKDFETYGPMVRKSGVIAFSGIAKPPSEAGSQVAEFWNEVKPQYRHSEFIEDKNEGRAGIGVLFVE